MSRVFKLPLFVAALAHCGLLASVAYAVCITAEMIQTKVSDVSNQPGYAADLPQGADEEKERCHFVRESVTAILGQNASGVEVFAPDKIKDQAANLAKSAEDKKAWQQLFAAGENVNDKA